MSMWSGKTGKKGTERAAFPLPSFLPLYFRVRTFLTICLGIGDFNLPSPVKATSKSHDQHPARASAFWELRRSRWPGRWHTTVTAKPKVKTSRQKQNTSRQNRKPHGKNKNFTAKPNTSQQKPNTSQQKPNTSEQKPNTSRQKQYPQQNQSYFAFAVKYLVLPWGILFLLWSFWFSRDVFVFAVKFLVLPWGILFLPWGFWFWCEVFCFCREVFGFALTVVGHHSGGIVVKEVLVLTLLNILPHSRFVQYLQLKYCNTEFIVRR